MGKRLGGSQNDGGCVDKTVEQVVAFIEEPKVIRNILEHCKLWKECDPRPPPPQKSIDPPTDKEDGRCSIICSSNRTHSESSPFFQPRREAYLPFWHILLS